MDFSHSHPCKEFSASDLSDQKASKLLGGWKQHLPFCIPKLFQYLFTVFLLFSPGFIKKALKFSSEACHLLAAYFILLNNLSLKLCGHHPSVCEKSALDPTHPPHDDLSKCRFHISTRSAFRSAMNINGNFIVPYLTHTLRKRDYPSADFLGNL